jgi:coenzyme F420-0:L-glutamate ligase / coenzyme F420-1:gamma-L-glutamate ligase
LAPYEFTFYRRKRGHRTGGLNTMPTCAPARMSLIALEGIPLIEPGDDLCRIIGDALRRTEISLQNDDILVVAQKVVSKAEGRIVELSTIVPSPAALKCAQMVNKDARHVEVVLRESEEVLKLAANALITVHRLGFVMANAGVDQSNVDQGGTQDGTVLLLPKDPDGSAAALKASIEAEWGVRIGVVISDSFGRPWRKGVTGVALGAAGVPSLRDLVGEPDLFDRKLRVSEHAAADDIAAAASLLMGQGAEGLPVVLIRGLRYDAPDLPASALLRSKHQDLFR